MASWSAKVASLGSGIQWIADWQANERARWANANVDGAQNDAGRSAYQYTGDATLWGKPIPITWGKRRITGQLLQIGIQSQQTTVEERPTFPDYSNSPILVSNPGINVVQNNLTWTPKTKFVSTFAYCFGQPGNTSAIQILRKLWFNGQLVYDIGQGYLSNEIRFRFYQGDNVQIPDAELNRERYTHPVAYRGLMYIVFYEYSIAAATGMGNPLVEAEFAEQVVNVQTAYQFDSFGSSTVAGVQFHGEGEGYDAKKNVLYVIGSDDNIYKYRGSDRSLLDVYPCEVTNMYASVFGLVRVANVPYLVGINAGSNSRAIYLINADTGDLVTQLGTNNSGFTPSATNYPGLNNATLTIVNEIGGEAAYVTVDDVFGDYIFIFLISNGEMTYITRYDIAASDSQWGITVKQAGSINTYHGSGLNLLKNNVVLHTGEFPITMMFTCPLDASIIVTEKEPASGPGYNIYKIFADGTIAWNLNEVNAPGIMPPTYDNDRIMASNTAGQRLAWRNGGSLVTLNFLSGSYEITPALSGWPTEVNMVYDAYSHSFIRSTGNPGYVEQRPILEQTTSNMLLSTFLRNLAERQGYETGNIQITGIDDQIIGAVISDVTNLDTVITDLKKAYNFEVIKRGPVIRFTRRGYGSDFEVDATIGEADRAITSDDGDEYVTVESEIAPPGQTPGTIRLKYIDPDYNYTANEFIHKRNADNVDVSSEMQLNLPIIMPGSDAAALAARVLLDSAMNGVTHEFRLPQKYLAYEPGDVFQLDFEDYSDTVRAVEIAYNADWSMSVKSEAILTDIGPTYDLEPPILPEENPALLSGEGEPIVFDTTLIQPTDQISIDGLEMYIAAIGSGRLPVVGGTTINKSADGQPYGPIGNSNDELTYGSAMTLLPAGPVMSIEYDAVLELRLLQGDGTDFATADKYDVLAGTANRLLVGREGRWEQIGFIEAAFDADTRVVTLTGLIRGLRGTEVMSGLHTLGDLVVLIEDDTILEDYEDVASLGDAVVYAVADNVGRLNTADAKAVPISGTTRMPWAVANVYVEDVAGDVEIEWQRRTRLYGPLNNGNPDVPLDEESELYSVDIYRAGNVVRTVENLTSPAYTYTAADQSTDGWSGPITSIQLDIFQISALVGRGFANAGTHDVN